MTSTYLSFTIFGELYAIPVEKVLEVLEKQEFTKVPNAPPVIKGILNFRGNAVPLYETRIKFNLPVRSDDTNFVIVVIDLMVGNDSYHVGAIVDKVQDVITLEENEIKPVPPMSKEFNAEFLKGIAKRDDQFILLIDVDKIFSSSEIKEIKNVRKSKNN
jgi:purine-binding chemotaxis protein CheW